jgi:excisionase family DNA binding protein
MSVRLLTTAEVAEIVRRHPKTVERAIRRGDLRATRLSGGDQGPYGVRPEWVDEWIERGVTEVPASPAVPSMPDARLPTRGGKLTVRPDMGRDRGGRGN